jgi:hypothetical protein
LYDSTRNKLTPTLTVLREECNKIDLNSTIDMISHIESKVLVKSYTYADLFNHLDTLSLLFSKELQNIIFFHIDKKKDEYFQKDGLFGPEVDSAFQSCVGEIQAAGICYALEQNEACVFHLMRVLERSLGVLASKFNVPFQHDNWHNIIEQLEAKIRRWIPRLALIGKTNKSSMLAQLISSCSSKMLGETMLCTSVMFSTKVKREAFLIVPVGSCKPWQKAA